MPVLVWSTRSEEETMSLGRALARALTPPIWVGLIGPLGAGKTRLVQGVAEGLAYPGRVRSPTFVLENRYAARVPIVHQDLYRLDAVDEEILAGWEENREAVVLVEWAERADELPDRRIQIEIVPQGDLDGPGEREIRLTYADGLIDLDPETRAAAREEG